MIVNEIQGKFPFDIKDNIYYTQHELVLNYKKNYCKDLIVLEDPNTPIEGGSEIKNILELYLYDE
jgi:hypothetical protein